MTLGFAIGSARFNTAHGDPPTDGGRDGSAMPWNRCWTPGGRRGDMQQPQRQLTRKGQGTRQRLLDIGPEKLADNGLPSRSPRRRAGRWSPACARRAPDPLCRICPIETPEGPGISVVINSLATFARRVVPVLLQQDGLVEKRRW